MTRKDYRKIAWAVNDTGDQMAPGAFDRLIDNLSSIFKRDNPRFDEEKFRRACETGEGAADISEI